MAPPNEVSRFADAVAGWLGLRLEPERASELLARRVAAHRETVTGYLLHLDTAPPDELVALASELTVGETYFLRHIEQFRAFTEVAVPDRLARGRLRVLSAGCSSGEEAYTLAMLLREAYPETAFEILAIDLNAHSIARARTGRYSRWSLRVVPPVFEQRWFRADGRDVVVVPEIRDAVTFRQGNLLEDADLVLPPQWDIVFFRNVMMYFTDDCAEAMIARLARAVVPGGYLFLGHAETLRGRSDDFTLRHSHGTFYYQRFATASIAIIPRAPNPPAALVVLPLPDDGWYDGIHAAARRVHAMVDGALDLKPGPRPDANPAPGPTPGQPAPPDAAARTELDAIRELVAHERFADALARLDQLRASTTTDRDVATLRALVLTHAGRFAEARVACAELLALDATSAGANYLLALCFDSTGDTDGAALLAQLAAELDPSFAMPRVHLGLLARRIGDRAIASQELTRAIALLEAEAPARLALYGGGFSRQALLGMCRAELAAIGAQR
jgi:chemotaxis protein methyltransferase CheR